MLVSRVMNLVPRSVIRQSIARSHDEVVYKGANVPFSIVNRKSLAIKMIIFVSIPFAIPYIVWRRRLSKIQGI